MVAVRSGRLMGLDSRYRWDLVVNIWETREREEARVTPSYWVDPLSRSSKNVDGPEVI